MSSNQKRPRGESGISSIEVMFRRSTVAFSNEARSCLASTFPSGLGPLYDRSALGSTGRSAQRPSAS